MRKLIFAFFLITNFSTSYAENSDGVDSIESESTIVFMRSSFVGAGIKTSIYEVTDDKTIFIGIMKNKTKINYKTTAGKHTFMVVSEAADFMKAEVMTGKTYYSMLTPRTGAWKARFSMIPIRNDGTTEFNTDSEKFEKWKKKTKVVVMNEKSEAWYEKHKDSVEEKRSKYWAKWMQKSAEDKLERTLKVSDGT
ncbi:MAG: hypothetical protein DRQ98_12435 [Gammaproteobacteria bacterium]|nr:MAG: hypothetical protein DRQ98_12435 [Gammaproteobacteria bacterium]